ncbi:hypothetical protein MSG28_007571 [Choristoneura fumiferana]|uniref:Uncharacterized protein n=1 Tax=Choristoneura fumiferana TaxID=7141 RepID=A0ACC0JXL8_CHOFU|nr:hypothetical protein MSG28_007571 [Choristoneura fumiferana]
MLADLSSFQPSWPENKHRQDCVFEVDKENGLTLTELADGTTIEDVLVSTGCEFHVSKDLKKMGDVTIDSA